MPHQTLQDLQRYTGIQHMHRIGMAERMWRDRDRERHTISGSGGNRFPNPGPDRSVRHFPDPRFLCPACSFITPFHGDFQCGHHRLQLADVPGVGKRNQPVSLLTGGHSSSPDSWAGTRSSSVQCCGWSVSTHTSNTLRRSAGGRGVNNADKTSRLILILLGLFYLFTDNSSLEPP